MLRDQNPSCVSAFTVLIVFWRGCVLQRMVQSETFSKPEKQYVSATSRLFTKKILKKCEKKNAKEGIDLLN